MVGKVRKLLSRALFKAYTVTAPDLEPERVVLRDQYIEWLVYANGGMLDPGTPHLLDYAISHLPNGAPILEIGSFAGLSTNLITYLKWKHGAKNRLVNCDKWDGDVKNATDRVGDSPLLLKDYRALIRETYLRNVSVFSARDLPYTIEKVSDDFFAAWNAAQSVDDVWSRRVTLGGPLSFCFIDGNHSYDFVKRDFLNCDKSLSVGGFVLFDDSVSEVWEVRLFIPEVFATGRYKLIATNPNHLFQKLS